MMQGFSQEQTITEDERRQRFEADVLERLAKLERLALAIESQLIQATPIGETEHGDKVYLRRGVFEYSEARLAERRAWAGEQRRDIVEAFRPVFVEPPTVAITTAEEYRARYGQLVPREVSALEVPPCVDGRPIHDMCGGPTCPSCGYAPLYRSRAYEPEPNEPEPEATK
jgi:hypothetical protein